MENKIKVYCNTCKNREVFTSIGDILSTGRCNHPSAVNIINTYWEQETVRTMCKIKNMKNDCPDYKKEIKEKISGWKKFWRSLL